MPCDAGGWVSEFGVPAWCRCQRAGGVGMEAAGDLRPIPVVFQLHWMKQAQLLPRFSDVIKMSRTCSGFHGSVAS